MMAYILFKIIFIMFTRVSPLILYLQAAVFLVLANFYLNPSILHSTCIQGNAESQTLGHGNIIDCSACLFQDGRDLLESRLSGDLDILLPLKNASGRLPVQSKNGDGVLSEKLMYLGHIYGQKGCARYNCNEWIDPKDFSIDGTEKLNEMKDLGLEKMLNMQFKPVSIVKRWFGSKPQEGKYIRFSSSVSDGNISSIMVKFRYNIVGDLSQQQQPIFLFHQIPDNLFIRLLLTGSVLFSILRLFSFFTVHRLPLPALITFLFCLTFLTEHLTSLGSSIAIFLIGFVLLEQKLLAVVLASAFFVVAIFGKIFIPLYQTSLTFIFLTIVLVWVIIGWRINESRPDLGQIIIISVFHGLVGLIYSWNYLLYVTPMNLMIGLLIIHHQTHQGQNTSVKQPYKNLNFHEIEEEEDVLAKIDKALENH